MFYLAFLGLPLDSLFSTQGIMVLLLLAYAGAMWMFLNSTPKVHTVMVSDLEIARRFYEEDLKLPVADIPLQYYYNYEQSMGLSSVDPLYVSPASFTNAAPMQPPEGLWYQLKKNVQLHAIGGANLGAKDRQRHVCFDRECLEVILMRVQLRGVRHKIRRDRPLNFLVKDWTGCTIELAETEA